MLHLFLLIRIFFAEFFASGGPTRSLCMHPFLFLRIFFTGLVVYVGPARLFFGLVCPKPSEIRAADLVLGAIMSWC